MEGYGSPYQMIDPSGYDQAVVRGIILHNVCSTCEGPLVKDYHPKPYTWVVKCKDPACSGTGYVSRRYLEVKKGNLQNQGDEFYSNFKDIIGDN